MDHNWTSLGSTVDGELKLATQLTKGDMILCEQQNFQKMLYVQVGVDTTTIFTENPGFFQVIKSQLGTSRMRAVGAWHVACSWVIYVCDIL